MLPNSSQPPGAGASGPQPPQPPSTQGTSTSAPAIISGISQSGLPYQDGELLTMFNRWKKESFDQRWIFERQWMRNVWYILNRQWIYFDSKRGQWQDKRLAKWVPRPVTNIVKTGVQSVRANFASIKYGPTARPLGEDNESVITASVASDYAPLLYEDHGMPKVMNEFDFWMLVTGNAFLHTYVTRDRKNGQLQVRYEQCGNCQGEFSEIDIANNKQNCPGCQTPAKQSMTPAIDPETGQQKVDMQDLAKGTTTALSPFELAFPIMYNDFEQLPYVIAMCWRDKSYFEQDEELAKTYAKTLSFTKVPQERTMQIFKTLPFQGDIGISPPYFASGGANVDSEGVVEYSVWVKPCKDFPDGAIIRIWGDSNPTIAHIESKESVPGPLPYHDGSGNPLFPFHMARYEHVGGRIYGSSMIDPAIQKQDQLNQLDSHMLMTIGRMANPIWLEPKGAEVEKFTGEPGLVVKWNPLVAGGNAKPERIPGEGINQSVFAYRGLIKQEAEELMGTFDIMKGEKPSGAEAYASLSFLYERATGRHASAYTERASCHKAWLKDALSIEQEFGEETRVRAVMQPTKGWAFQTFKKADLRGNVEIIVEDGAPKTTLTERADIDHLAQLGMLDPNDPEQKIAIFDKFGQQRLMPSVDAQVQEAWMNMEKFEQFIGDPTAIAQAEQAAQIADQQAAMTGQPAPPVGPLVYRRWYNAQIHRNELIKWCLSDRGRKVFQDHPAALQMVDAYLTQIDLAIAQTQEGVLDAGGQMIQTQPPPQPGAPQPGQPGQPGSAPQQQGMHGRAQQMANSNQNAAGAGPSSSGSAGTGAPGAKPMDPSTAVNIAQRLRAVRYLNNPKNNQQ